MRWCGWRETFQSDFGGAELAGGENLLGGKSAQAPH